MFAALVASTCLALSGSNITARDLARAVPQFTPSDPDSVVAYAPAPGVERTLYPEELRQALSRLNFTAPDSLEKACFVRPVNPLRSEDVMAAMRRTLGNEARIDILEISGFPVPAGDITFPRESLSPPPQAIWRGYVTYDGSKKFSIWARVAITVKTVHAIAKDELRPGAGIRPDQVRFESVEGFPETRQTPHSVEELDGCLPRHFIAADSPIWNDAIDPPNEVTKGDHVTVVVNSGHARLSFDAEAENSGRHGDLIALKNLDSGKLFRARVDGPEQARIDTNPPRANQ